MTEKAPKAVVLLSGGLDFNDGARDCELRRVRDLRALVLIRVGHSWELKYRESETEVRS